MAQENKRNSTNGPMAPRPPYPAVLAQQQRQMYYPQMDIAGLVASHHRQSQELDRLTKVNLLQKNEIERLQAVNMRQAGDVRRLYEGGQRRNNQMMRMQEELTSTSNENKILVDAYQKGKMMYSQVVQSHRKLVKDKKILEKEVEQLKKKVVDLQNQATGRIQKGDATYNDLLADYKKTKDQNQELQVKLMRQGKQLVAQDKLQKEKEVHVPLIEDLQEKCDEKEFCIRVLRAKMAENAENRGKSFLSVGNLQILFDTKSAKCCKLRLQNIDLKKENAELKAIGSTEVSDQVKRLKKVLEEKKMEIEILNGLVRGDPIEKKVQANVASIMQATRIKEKAKPANPKDSTRGPPSKRKRTD